MHGLEKEYSDRIDFVSVNILNRESEALIYKFSFSTTPEFYLVNKQGEIIHFWSDLIEEDELRQAFDEALKEE